MTASIMTTIHVTQEHIDHGVRGTCSKCPVALAIKQHVMPGTQVRVANAYVWLDNIVTGDRMLGFPATVSVFIYAFDHQSKPVAPFSFDLSIPPGF